MKHLLILLITVVGLTNCRKKDSPTSMSIDTSKVYYTDASGKPLLSDTVDGQWKQKNFNSKELSLFNSLDTANLSNTTLPTSVLTGFAYPSPFKSNFNIPITFNPSFSGRVVLKFVIVDNRMNVIQRATYNAKAVTSSNRSTVQVAINPNVSIGKFRLYLTISSQNNNDFFKTWGNIEKF